MNKNQNVIDVLDKAIKKAKSYRAKISDVLELTNVLIQAADSLKLIFEERGKDDEWEFSR